MDETVNEDNQVIDNETSQTEEFMNDVEDSAEDTGEAVDDSAEDAEDAVEDGIDDAQDDMDDADTTVDMDTMDGASSTEYRALTVDESGSDAASFVNLGTNSIYMMGFAFILGSLFTIIILVLLDFMRRNNATKD